MNGIYLLLGSNLGNRLTNFQKAVELLQLGRVIVKNSSAIYETAPWGITDQPSFLNMVIEVQTKDSPSELLAKCLQVEHQMGRIRAEKWGSRIIDVDILFYNDLKMNEPDLIIPHPGIPERLFTLLPLCDLVPDEIDPNSGQTIKELLDKLTDDMSCQKTDLVLAL